MTTHTAQRTWDDACLEAVLAIKDRAYRSDLYTLEPYEALSHISHVLSGMKSAANGGSEYDRDRLIGDMERIGAIASTQVTRPSVGIANLLADKQANYGTGNILSFGYTGLHVRMSDKIARLHNMLGRERDSDVEPLADSWLDLVGYATIASMLNKGTFELPLRRDI